MRFEECTVDQALGMILAHNVADSAGRRVLRKGVCLTEQDVTQLAKLGHQTVTVAVLEAGDVHEDEAAATLGTALQTEQLHAGRPAGGRVNLHAMVDGLLEVDAGRLLALNLLPGITLATRPYHLVVGPNQDTDFVATLKIVPYAVRRSDLGQAMALAQPRPGIVEIRPLPHGRRVALLLIGAPAVHDKLRDDFLPPTRTRVERLGAKLVAVEAVSDEIPAISKAATRLALQSDLIVVAGQTSIMDEDDTTLCALRQSGAEIALHGVPVEPGNLLALAYFRGTGTPVLCAPGSARGLNRSVVDLILPRLLVGEHLGRAEIAALGLGGLLAGST
jgi:molybdenum cofactor cytidylyltransferase